MRGRTLAFVILGSGCMVAAAAGGYLALRQNHADTRLDAAQISAQVTPTPPTGPASAIEPTTSSDAAKGATDLPAPKPSAKSTANTSRKSERATPRGHSPAYPATHPPSQPPPAAVVQAPPPAPVDATLPPLPVTSEPPPPPPVPTDPPPPPTPDPPQPTLIELTVQQNSVMGIRLDNTISSDTAKVEDRVVARVTRDVVVDGHTAIPSGTKLEGVVSAVMKGGKFKEQAHLGVKFNTMIMNDGSRVPMQTETILRDGESPSGSAASKVGAGAVIGSILGAVLGGKKGAVIGGTAGAGGGTAAVEGGDASQAILAAGTNLTLRLTAPVTVIIEK